MTKKDVILQLYHQRKQHLKVAGQGFTLVEIIIAIAIFALAVMTSASIFGGTSKMIRDSKTNNELARLVDEDFAYVLQSNERLTCKANACVLNTSDTNRNSYFPDVPSSGAPTPTQQTNIDFFQAVCTSTDIATGFASRLNSLIQPPSDSRITRTITSAPLNGPSHLYTITYTNSTGQLLRQNHLVPTAVSWCPALIP